MTQPARVLTVIVCGAGPASEVGQLVKLARERGWTVQVVSTPAALDFIDVTAIEAQTGGPVRSQYRKLGEPRSRPADAIIVAPATYNTINKWAHGISDTYALGILAETTALGVPIVVLPFVNSALAARAPFRRNVEELRREGVRILLGFWRGRTPRTAHRRQAHRQLPLAPGPHRSGTPRGSCQRPVTTTPRTTSRHGSERLSPNDALPNSPVFRSRRPRCAVPLARRQRGAWPWRRPAPRTPGDTPQRTH